MVNQLTRVINELQHKQKLSDEDVKKDLLIVFHLVGDLHQPLHVGYGADKGGNDVQVKYRGHPTNLHKVWDSEIIESENITLNDCLQQINSFDNAKVTSLATINVPGWMQQPRAQLPQVYSFRGGNIDEDYIQKGKKLIEQDILMAGIRLSAVLKTLCQ